MDPRPPQPPLDGGEHLRRQLVEISSSAPVQILRPVALRAVAPQPEEARRASASRDRIDVALPVEERHVAYVLAIFVGF